MKKKLIPYVIYVLVLASVFYVLPLLIQDTGSGMFVLLLVFPALTFIASLVYGILRGFDIVLPVAVAMLFIPTLFIFYNESAWVYIPAYSVIALIGNGFGRVFIRKGR